MRLGRSRRLPAELSWTVRATTALVLVFALLPILVITLMSFGTANSLAFPPSEFGLHWYREAFQVIGSGPGAEALSLRDALQISLEVGILTAIGAAIAAIPAAYVLHRFQFRGRAVVETLIELPVVFPAVVLGLAMLVLANLLPFELGIWRLVVAHMVLVLPFAVRNCTASLVGVGPELEEAARTLGASPWRAVIGVVLPLMRGGVLAGMILSFVISFNEFTVTFFLYTADIATLPIWLYSRTVASLDPTVFSLAVLIVILDAMLIYGLERLVGPDALVA